MLLTFYGSFIPSIENNITINEADLKIFYSLFKAHKHEVYPTIGLNYEKDKEWIAYAEEADLLNVALFNCTAKDWREVNPDLAKKSLNIRDIASINELVT